MRIPARMPGARFAWCVVALLAVLPAAARAQNAIVVENQLPGNPSAQWDVNGAGDLSIQGFATDISVNVGTTVHFKIKTDADAYHVDIYRLGYYQGNGARKVGTGVVTASLPQAQPADLYDAVTGLTDCGNWGESAHWDVPANAVSGIYVARLTRDDNDGASHIAFIVRNDASTSDLLFQTSDATWQAYNVYGGNSLYVGVVPGFPGGHASKVSYNRPFLTRSGGGGSGGSEDWLFNAEYPMLRWLEANGYDVTYTTDVDTDRRGNLIPQHKVFLSVGHDEYWSAGARANVTAARDAGVHLAFFSGNEIYWKTRYEPSTDGTNTSYRTLVCYKEGTLGENVCGTKCDPEPTWTGLWRDGCAPTYAANDGCAPENALSGQISWTGSTGAIMVPDTFKNLRFWRNTSIAALGAGQSVSLAPSSLGYEWDHQQFAASYPARRILLSTTNLSGQTHHLSLYRADSGALVFGAGTVQWMWGLDSNHDNGSNPPNQDMKQATVNLLADMGSQPASLEVGLVNASASSDALAPTSVIGFPLDGGSVPSGTPVTISGTASDTGGGLVAGVEVSVDGGTSWNPATGASSWSYVWIPGAEGAVTLKSRAFDDTGNLEVTSTAANTIALTVTAPAAPTCPCTIWPASAVGGVGTDGNAVELGVRFRADVAGVVKGVRFYKLGASTGTHVGHLWTNGGTPMGTATFTGESASGWQQVDFGSPIDIDAGTTYVVSVFMPNGNYAFTGSYFATTGVDNPPLHALADNVDGRNGVYLYGGGFPTDTFNAANYWVDVVFDNSGGPDVTPPVIVAIAPGNGTSGVPVGSNVTATFSEAMDAGDISETNLELRDPGNNLVARSVSYNSVSHVATIDPTAPLAYSTTYTARVLGAVRDASLNALGTNVTWSFTTGAPPPPPPTEGPGGPILVVTDAGDPFGRYCAEILRTEGLNEFSAMDISLVNAGVLAGYDVVLVHDQNLSAPQVTMLTDWVDAGGNLIAIRPDPQLAPLLGLTTPAGTLSNAYLLASGAGPSAGIVGETIQFHGAADLWTASGATVLATLYSDATTATTHPAVTLRSVGGNGGQAACFTYDLARSIVYTRQGNPAWVGQERDAPDSPTAAATLRADDMFYGNAPGDPQPDWNDFSKIAIPQADEQQRLLANLILSMNLDKKPLPRFWYFPKGKKAVVIMTGDNHGDGGMASRFQTYVNQSPSGCSPDDWDCVRASGYMYLGGGFTDAQALAFHNQGFEVGLHINTDCANWTETTLRNYYDTQLSAYTAAYPDLPVQSSNRTHCGAWSDWTTQARVEAEKGIRLDTNYYYWPPTWVQDRPGMFTGSGMPMRFANLDGTMVDCYQAVTQMTDESGQSYPATVNTLLDRALGAEGYYGAFCANMHFDSSPHTGSDQIVASAISRGVPVVSGRQMMNWLDGRNASSFGSMSWASNALSFTVAVGSGANNLRGMVPRISAVGPLNGLTLGGVPVAYTVETVKGIEYAMFPASAGSYVADYSPDETPPVISDVAALALANGTATVTWTTDEPADSRVDYGTTSALGTTVQSATLVTSHSVQLTGLAPNTMYSYRVTSADAIANGATHPNPPADPLAFTTPAPQCFADDVTVDFGAGTPSGTYVSRTDDGEVILAPAVASEFDGTTVPAGFGSFTWNPGGGSTVAAGSVTVDGARLNSLGTTYGPGLSLEFVATFGAGAFQAVGMGGGGDVSPGAIYDGPPWVMFSTGSSGTAIQARTHNGSSLNDETLPLTLLGSPHRYRIDWKPASVDYYVDGVLVTTHAIAVAGPMRPAASDYNTGGASVAVDWLHMTPYPNAGTFTSRVFDGASSTDWGSATWSATTPAGTSLGISVRTGNTPSPDGSWSAFLALPASGSSVGASSRYIQYRADLATTNVAVTPALLDIAFSCAPAGPDVTPPTISNVEAAPAPSGTEAAITWTTDEPADSRVDYGLTTALGSNAATATLVLSHSIPLSGLLSGTTYYYRVRSADAATNAAESPVTPATLSFTTPAAQCAADDSDAEFAAGSTAEGTYVARVDDGEVILQPTVAAEFGGALLPPEFGTFSWSGGGGSTVSGGLLSIDGHRVNSLGPTFTPGRSLEFVATFGNATFQHIGFAFGNDLPPGEMYNNTHFAAFSTGNSSSELRARSGNGGGITETSLGALLGTPHRYRIDWKTDSVDFYVDGALVATHTITIPGPMRPAASDFGEGGPVLTIDWLRMTPYLTPGAFTSRVHDAGAPVSWQAFSWTATTPVGTSLLMKVRTGNVPVPDGTWSAYTTLAGSGSPVGTTARYLQYRAELSTTDPALTPALAEVTVNCAACSGPALAGLADLAVTRQGVGGSAGRLPIAVTFTSPAGATAIEVYRAPFGGYPRYDDAGGVMPATPSYPPGSPWVLTGVTASGGIDNPGTRDVWHYVAFARDACGVVTAVSNRPAGIPNYILGDVSDGLTVCAGDNLVATADLTLLGAHYGELLTGSEAWACLDVGPTLDSSRLGRPLTDSQLDFEDLVLFGLNYGSTGPAFKAVPRTAAGLTVAARDALTLEAPSSVRAGETFTVALRMAGAGRVQGFSTQLDWNAIVAEPAGMTAGDLLEVQRGVVYSSAPGRIDAVLLGVGDQGIAGEGVVATLRFRALADGDPGLRIGHVLARDAANRPIELGGEASLPPLPTLTTLERVVPNPFRGQASAQFSLAQEGAVDLSIFAVDGRRIRTLLHGVRPAGRYQVLWNGEDESGARVRPGQYYVRFLTSSGRITRKLVYLR